MYFSRIFVMVAVSCTVISAGPIRDKTTNSIFSNNITTSAPVPSGSSIEIIPITLSTISATNQASEFSGSATQGATGSKISVQATSTESNPTSSEPSGHGPSVSIVATNSIFKPNSSSISLSKSSKPQSTITISIPSITETIPIPTGTNPLSTTASDSLVSDTFTGIGTFTITFSKGSPSPSISSTSTSDIIEIPTALTGIPTSTTSATPSLLAQNLAQAQSFNSLFLTLNASSPCTLNQVACLPVPNAALSNTTGIGICNAEGKYVITPCQNSVSASFGDFSSGCFAMPLQNAIGVEVECVEVGAAGNVLGPSATPPSVAATPSLIASTSVISATLVSSSTLITSIAQSLSQTTTLATTTTTVQSTSTETLESIITFSVAASLTSSPGTSTAISSTDQSVSTEPTNTIPLSTSESTVPTATSSGGEIIITIVPVTLNSLQPITVTETVTVTVHDK